MCVHSKEEYEWIAKRAEENESRYGWFAGLGPLGGFRGSWYCHVEDLQDITNGMNDLRRWHGAVKFDLSYLNRMRVARGLPEVDQKGLPKPSREAQPEFSHEEVARLVEAEDYENHLPHTREVEAERVLV